MPSRRMIDPAFWQSETVANLPIPVRYFFIGLFSNADDQGRMKAHPALIRSKLYPYDDVPLQDISEWLALLVLDNKITIYQNDDKDYLQILNWWKYQRPRWAWPSEYPAPDGWTDRLHYRRGNAVMSENWHDDDPSDINGPDDDDSAVEPEWNQTDTTMEPAPSISTSISDSNSGNDYELIRAAWAELFPDKPQPRANNATLRGKVRTRMRSAHFRNHWRQALERAAQSQFLLESPWFDLAWILKNDDHYERCLSGKYDDRARSPPKPKSSAAIETVIQREGWDHA